MFHVFLVGVEWDSQQTLGLEGQGSTATAIMNWIMALQEHVTFGLNL